MLASHTLCCNPVHQSEYTCCKSQCSTQVGKKQSEGNNPLSYLPRTFSCRDSRTSQIDTGPNLCTLRKIRPIQPRYTQRLERALAMALVRALALALALALGPKPQRNIPNSRPRVNSRPKNTIRPVRQWHNNNYYSLGSYTSMSVGTGPHLLCYGRLLMAVLLLLLVAVGEQLDPTENRHQVKAKANWCGKWLGRRNQKKTRTLSS